MTTFGGTSAQAVFYSYVTASAPTLAAVSPTSGPASGGTTVVLTGTNFAGASAVRFGTTAATSFTIVSNTHISAVAPAGSGTVQVTVITPGGTSNGVSFGYAQTPVVSGASPHQGPLSGGNTVILTGVGLAGTTAVTFGATGAASFTVDSPTQITAVAPPGAAGPVNITVTAPGGTSAAGTFYYYVNTPVLTHISPSSGPVSGGNSVTVAGANLIGATAVHFGTTTASSFTVVSAIELTAVVPLGTTGIVPVTVTTAGGTSNGLSYAYLVTPTIAAVTPSHGPATGGNTVTMAGTSLTQATTVLFGSVPAAFTIVSDNQISAAAPAGEPGPVTVTVTTPGGTAPAQTYIRVGPPGI